VANAPNEVDLGRILTDEVGKYYNVKEADFQSDFILRNMLDWFKKKESNFMTSKEAIDLFRKGKEKMKSLRRTSVSIHYQRQLKQALEFNRDAIHIMAGKLMSFLISFKKIEHIWTRLPTRTAVKVIEALKELRENIPNKNTDAVAPHEVYFHRKDSYLMTPFAEKEDHKKFKTLLKASELSHNLLIFVCDNEPLMENQVYYEKLVKNSENKKVIFISQGDAVEETKEDLTFADLSAKFKKALLSKKVLFQGTCQTVENLITRSFQTADDFIESGASEIMNSNAIEELIKKERLEIACFTSSRFEKSLYIKRQLTSAFPFDKSFWSEVAKELGYSTELLESKCRISLQGEIEWFVIGEEKTNIWEKINIILDKNKAVQPSKIVAEDDLVNNKNHKEEKPDVVIISGVAGSGKSSILSHYYEVIKETNPEHWVIVISLTDHSAAFSKLKSTEVNKTSVTDFLSNLAIVDQSPFACSLLKHRLETGDRMVIMLDGFDESHHQETVIEMIKIFKKMQLNGLLVTTRSHMTSQIQFELSQLSYSLSNFSKRDQIEYLTSVWQRDFKSNAEKDLRNFATSLVDRVSKTLRDEERAFIGIPLQCRILAECFQSELLKSFQQDNTFGSFRKTIQNLNLSLAGLYRLLMEKKHEIYRQEKKAQSCASDLASSHAKEDIDHLEPFLRKLAIETIVACSEHVDALLGKKKSMKPKDTLDKKKERMVDHCSRFGLLDRDAKGKVRFLHRTYAEYLMAEYLYTGFLLDDEKRNHLLEYKSARKLIIGKILVKNQYDGVQIFLDSMLKEMVDDNEEWRNGIIQRKLPDGLHRVAQVFFTRVVHLKIKENPLELSVANKREKIFKFLCDCLDATFDKPQVLRAIRASFTTRYFQYYYYSFKNFCHLNSEVFQRYIDYFDDVPITQNVILSPKEKNHVHTVMKGLFRYHYEFPLFGLKFSFWNGEEQQKMVHPLLQFMDNHRQVLNEIIPKAEYPLGTMLAMLIFNKNYDSQLELLVNLLAKSDLYSDDFTFANFMKNVFLSVKRKYRMGLDNRLKKTLAIFKKLDGRHELLNQISILILKIEPNAFKMIYQPCQLLEDEPEGLPTDFHLRLERDSFRFSCFHRADTHGGGEQTDFVDKLLTVDWTPDPKANQIATECVNYYDFTPFYVAATWGHEKICCNLLAFLKRHLPGDTFKKGLTDINGFVHRPLSDAIAYENTEMYIFILKIVKKTLGQEDLITLLQSTVQEKFSTKNKAWTNDWTNTSMFTVGYQYKMFQTIADIVLDSDIKTGKTNLYEDLNDLIFDSGCYGEVYALKDVNVTTLQGLMSFKGSDDWTKRLLNLGVYQGFTLLVDSCVTFFSQDQLLQFVNTVTSKGDRKCSYWGSVGLAANVGNKKIGIGDLRILKFLKFISKKLGETILMKLVLHDEGDENSFGSYILSQSLVNILSNNLSKKGKEKVRHHFRTKVPLMIEELFFNPDSEHYWKICIPYSWISMTQLYLDYANEDQLKKFVNFITLCVKNVYDNQQSIWSYIFLDSVAESNEILKRVYEKPSTFGQNAVKTLLHHELNNFPVILHAALKSDFNDRIVGLPNQIQDEIQTYVTKHTPQLIEECFRNPITQPGISWQHFNLHKFICIFNYCNSNQLEEFIAKFTCLRDETSSIWGKIFADSYVTENSIQTMHKFLKCVSEKLGQNEVMRLVLHDDGDGAIICSKALQDQESLIEAMLSYLDTKNKKKVQRKIDGYLAEKLKDTGATERIQDKITL
jgi:hypothetical protein